MQEPILWNQSITANVLYGKPDATDEEVRRACELANATSFIESDFEELNKEQRMEKSDSQLADLLANYAKTHSELEILAKYSGNETLTPLLVEVLTKADEKALKMVNTNIAQFEEFIK